MKAGNDKGFTLVEVLAAAVLLSLSAVSVTAAWRLADFKAFRARMDHRALRLLREYQELQRYVPSGFQPLTEGGSLQGYLYHPKQVKNPFRPSDQLINYTVSLESGKMVIAYQMPAPGKAGVNVVTQSVSMINP